MQRIVRMDHIAWRKTVKTLHAKTGRSSLWIVWDMWRCAKRYGAGYSDYALFEMYRLTDAQRDTYLTRGRNNELMKRYNDAEEAVWFDDKSCFDERFRAYLGREFISGSASETDIEQFVKRHETVVVKPANGMCGKGVTLLDTKTYTVAEIRRLVKEASPCVVEQALEQHPALAAVYPLAINTARIVTIVSDGLVHVICAYWGIGNNGARVDNFNSGGMVAPIDVASGVVCDYAVDKTGTLFTRHPYSDKPIKGTALPYWEQALALVSAAAKEVERMRYIGWDVAFAPDGVCLIEGNNFAGHDIYQLPAHTPNGVGLWPKFQV